jgi:hypothetical protein
MKNGKTMPSLPDHMGVQFRHVPGYPGYCVGDDGSVWSCLTTRRRYYPTWHGLKPADDGDGYRTVSLRNPEAGTSRTHRVNCLVLLAFIGPRPEGMDACHDPDPNPANNRLSNLRWGTRKANVEDARRHGRMLVGEKGPNAKLTEDVVRQIRAAYKRGVFGHKSVAKQFGVPFGTVTSIIHRKSWAHI